MLAQRSLAAWWHTALQSTCPRNSSPTEPAYSTLSPTSSVTLQITSSAKSMAMVHRSSHGVASAPRLSDTAASARSRLTTSTTWSSITSGLAPTTIAARSLVVIPRALIQTRFSVMTVVVLSCRRIPSLELFATAATGREAISKSHQERSPSHRQSIHSHINEFPS